MYQTCFVILHYLSYEATAECVDSIRAVIAQTSRLPYHIIIVDNASPNDSYARLQERYGGLPDVTLMRTPENLGFARGNNLGYRYALEELGADFVVIANNDTKWEQPDFLERMVQVYERENCALIGPDIYNTGGYHQNPYRGHMLTKRELDRWIRNRRLWLLFLLMDKYLHLTKIFPAFRKFYDKRAAAGRPEDTWRQARDNVVLQGACILFTPAFCKENGEYAFYPGTFLYCEEEILALYCSRHGLSLRYEPSLWILHKESVSTSLAETSAWENDYKFTRNMLDSLSILRRLWEKGF